MGNRFSTQSVNSFLMEHGCDDVRANFISTFVVTALRSVSVHAAIANQTVNEDFTAYHVEVAANGGDGFVVDYSVSKLGPGFFDHRAKVTTPHAEYTVTRLIHTPQVAEEPAAPVAVAEVPAEEAATVTEEAAPVVMEEVVAVTEEAPVEASEELPPAVEAALEDAAEAFVEAVVEEAPKAKKGKAKKKAD